MDENDLKNLVKQNIHDRVREGVKAVIEQILEEEMNLHLQAQYRERTELRRGERNGHYSRSLITPVGKVEQLQVPRDREGEFLTDVFERYKRMTGDVEEAVLEMYLQGVSTRKVSQVTQALSRVKVGKDAVSRIAGKLEEELRAGRERKLEKRYPYLVLDACYLKVNWGSYVGELALLVAIGVNQEGYRELLTVEAAGGERKEAYRNLLKGLNDRGLRGVQLVISDDHEAIKQAVMSELPGVQWQRCVVHFERNILAQVPAKGVKEVAEDLKAIFNVSRESSARHLAQEFIARYQQRFPKAVAVFERGLVEALTFLRFPSSHHRLIRSTNGLERLFREVKRRTRVVGVFPGELSALNLATAVLLRVTEEWSLRKYLDVAPLEAMNANPQH
jgi:putative transposase